ncbi:MAG: hypothetical protein DMG14_24315 [Acidobacteria bacterium]|nr:MAG: hypothetical protein DMG14_24315 [Acidobacteriota bacterium]
MVEKWIELSFERLLSNAIPGRKPITAETTILVGISADYTASVDQRRIALLIVIAGIMPLGWGWTVHWLVSRLWPQKPARQPRPPRSSPPLDYQI